MKPLRIKREEMRNQEIPAAVNCAAPGKAISGESLLIFLFPAQINYEQGDRIKGNKRFLHRPTA